MIWPNGAPAGVYANVSPTVALGGSLVVTIKGPSGITCGGVAYYPDKRTSVTLSDKPLTGGTVSWSEPVGSSMVTGGGSVNLWCQKGSSSWIGSGAFTVVKAPSISWTLSTTVTASTSDVTFTITGPNGANCSIVVGQGSWGFLLGSPTGTGMTVWNQSLGPWAAGTFAYTLSCTYAGATKSVKGTFVVQ